MRAVILSALVLSSASWAQDKKADAKSRVQQINFEDDTVEGDLTKPDVEYIDASKRVRHSNIIKIREEFKDKVMQSVGEL